MVRGHQGGVRMPPWSVLQTRWLRLNGAQQIPRLLPLICAEQLVRRSFRKDLAEDLEPSRRALAALHARTQYLLLRQLEIRPHTRQGHREQKALPSISRRSSVLSSQRYGEVVAAAQVGTCANRCFQTQWQDLPLSAGLRAFAGEPRARGASSVAATLWLLT